MFPALADGLGLGVDSRPTRPRMRGGAAPPAATLTTDDLIAASVGLAASAGGPPIMTGFVLANPRVIVTDGYSGNTGQFDPNAITILMSSGRRTTTRAGTLFPAIRLDRGCWTCRPTCNLPVCSSAQMRFELARRYTAVAAGERGWPFNRDGR